MASHNSEAEALLDDVDENDHNASFEKDQGDAEGGSSSLDKE